MEEPRWALRQPQRAPLLLFPWGAALLSALLTGVGIQLARTQELDAITGNVVLSVILLVFVVLVSFLLPQVMMQFLLAFQLPIYLLASNGVIGNSMNSYLSFVILLVVAGTIAAGRYGETKTASMVPGYKLILALCLVGFLQWCRQMIIGVPFQSIATITFLDMTNFGLGLYVLSRVSNKSIQSLARYFVVGVIAGSLVLILSEFKYDGRLGARLNANPGYFGYLAGWGILILLSQNVFSGIEKGLRYVFIVGLIVFVFFTGSRTPFFASGVSLAFIFAFKRKYYHLAVALLMAILASYEMNEPMNQKTSAMATRMATPFSEEFSTSGARRDQIWSYLLSSSQEYWYYGAGIGKIPTLTSRAGLTVHSVGLQSHNIYLTTLIEMGVVAILFLLAWELRFLFDSVRSWSDRPLMLGIFIFFLVEGFFSGTNLTFLTAFCLSFGNRIENVAWSLASAYREESSMKVLVGLSANPQGAMRFLSDGHSRKGNSQKT